MIVATGPQGVAIATLARMVASTVAFRNRRGEYTIAEASQSVYYPYLDDPEQSKKPFCVCTTNNLEFEKVADQTFRTIGMIELWIADNDDLFESPQESKIDFVNFVDGILTELTELSGTDDLLHIIKIHQIMEPMQSSPKEVAAVGGAQVPYWLTKYGIDWSNFEA